MVRHGPVEQKLFAAHPASRLEMVVTMRNVAVLGSLLLTLPLFQAVVARSTIEFASKDGQIYADGEPFYIKGVNWFGSETIEKVPQGLWPSATTMGDMLDLLETYNVNALRLPLAIDSILDDSVVSAGQVAGTTALVGKSYLEVLDVVVNECRTRNILVLFDNHRMKAADPDFPDIAEADKIAPALEKLASRYCDNPLAWNVLGIDIKNEPKGKATWGMGHDATDWNVAAATIGNAVLSKCSRWLIFVEGVQNNIKGETLEWGQVGGSLQGAKEYPVKLQNMERLVYSPHLISPGVDYKSPWWLATDFPSNMEHIWDDYFGFVPEATGNAVVIGAWGAKMKGKDKQWATTVAAYVAKKNVGSFYWAVNPQSADTGGLVRDDWKSPIEERFALLADLPFTNVSAIVSVYAQCTDACDGFGECVDGNCVCYNGWSGPQCEICSEGETRPCNDGGVCQSDSTCLCDSGFGGKYCSGEDCDFSCGVSNYASCHNGACICAFHCSGNDCTPCASNSSALATGLSGSILCDACEAPDSDTAMTSTTSGSLLLLWLVFVITSTL